MPDAYTHTRIARAALTAARLRVPFENVYETGAQGPDPLLSAHALRGRKSDLPALARRMHTQDCGAFLVLLLQNAQTPAQRSYALGFLLHYAADTALHPYVLAQCAAGQPYEQPFGHGFCEAALDSFFCEADNGTRAVPLKDAAPGLQAGQLAEVCALLKKTVRSVYGQEVPALDFADAFHLFRLGHKHSGKRLLARTADVLLRKKGCLLSHTTPQKPPKDGFPKTWTHPETGEAQATGPHALCMQAVNKGADYLAVAGQLWQGKITPAQCWHKLGSNSYFTGLPCKKEPEAAQVQPREETPESLPGQAQDGAAQPVEQADAVTVAAVAQKPDTPNMPDTPNAPDTLNTPNTPDASDAREKLT